MPVTRFPQAMLQHWRGKFERVLLDAEALLEYEEPRRHFCTVGERNARLRPRSRRKCE